jgi:hypothetical protein
MAVNTNVERLSSKSAPRAWSSLPELPQLPKALRERSPLYDQYDADMQVWWKETRSQLERILREVSNNTDT